MVIDYSQHEGSLNSLDGANSFTGLTNEQVAEFWDRGFLAGVPVLSQDDCSKLLEEIETFREGNHPGHDLLYEYHANQTGDPNKVLMHSLGHWRLTKGFHDLIYLPIITQAASRLLIKHQKTSVRFWHDQLFVKPPKTGSVVAWHQDYSYWTRTVPMQHLTVHVALDDQDEDNGCIHYVPGSHKWTRDGGRPLPVVDFDFKDPDLFKTILTDEEKRDFNPVPVRLKRGEAVFHHPLAVHGSLENKSDRWRRAAVINYMADGTKSSTSQPLLNGVPAIPEGEAVCGLLFPLVLNCSAMI